MIFKDIILFYKQNPTHYLITNKTQERKKEFILKPKSFDTMQYFKH